VTVTGQSKAEKFRRFCRPVTVTYIQNLLDFFVSSSLGGEIVLNQEIPLKPFNPDQPLDPAALPDRRARRFLTTMTLSIRTRLLLAFFIVGLMLMAPYAFLILPALQYKRQYDSLITNLTTANSIMGYIQPAIDAETWEIVAGKKEFQAGQQYAILEEVNRKLRQMVANTDSKKGRVKLDVILRTMTTLKAYEDRLGEQLAAHATFDQNMVVLEEIRRVSILVEEDVKDYALFEVNRTEQQYRALQTSLDRWAVASGIGIAAAALFSIVAAWHISRSIYLPIRKLHDVTTTLARQDLELLVTADNADEITELGLSFNIMVGKIRELLAAKIKEQEELKKAELRTLQAQINPHFLYNTLDTIIWMAEGNRTHQVVELVRALSRFFRITLSKGKDWITLREEFDHVGSYLAIQKMRYHDILDYHLELAEDLQDGTILKLTLQPLVENALYHGIKNKRNGGRIAVRGRRIGEANILIEVEDQGIGIPLEKLAQLQTALTSENGAVDVKEAGFGIANVNQRLKLYYGAMHGLSIESEYLTGTRVSFVIPLRRD